MIRFSFLYILKESNKYKNIIVTFDSSIDGYEIVEDKGTFKSIEMNTETCKLRNFEKEVKKFIKRKIYNQNSEINALTDLSLDFRLNYVYISGKQSVVKKVDIKEKRYCNKQQVIANANDKNNSKEITKEKQNKSKKTSQKNKKREKKKKKKKNKRK